MLKFVICIKQDLKIISVAPVLSEYMRRMMHSGYPEKYRIHTLSRSRLKWLKRTLVEPDHCTGQKIGML